MLTTSLAAINPQISSKKMNSFLWLFGQILSPQLGAKKLGNKNCAQLPIYKKRPFCRCHLSKFWLQMTSIQSTDAYKKCVWPNFFASKSCDEVECTATSTFLYVREINPLVYEMKNPNLGGFPFSFCILQGLYVLNAHDHTMNEYK
jgi:hypothetical protein